LSKGFTILEKTPPKSPYLKEGKNKEKEFIPLAIFRL
jgi:hypothetical protein